jgi:leucyl/phenylalanyl-tRNA--protein transferase
MPEVLPPVPPVEPPRTGWRLPDLRRLTRDDDGHDLLAVGADLQPGTLLAAYRCGLFPMHVTLPVQHDDGEEVEDVVVPSGSEERSTIGWWSPDPRGVLPLSELRVSRSLRQSIRRFRWSVDQAFDDVVAGCADRGRADGWINDEIAEAYGQLHALGWAHSIEVWAEDELVGGLYGVAIGGLFAGESMFHLVPDASKVALVHLVRELASDGRERLLDVQWVTPHLASLGAVEIPREHYRRRLERALELPLPRRWENGR